MQENMALFYFMVPVQLNPNIYLCFGDMVWAGHTPHTN